MESLQRVLFVDPATGFYRLRRYPVGEYFGPVDLGLHLTDKWRSLNFGTGGGLTDGLRDGVYSDAAGSYQVINGVNTYIPNHSAFVESQGRFARSDVTIEEIRKAVDRTWRGLRPTPHPASVP